MGGVGGVLVGGRISIRGLELKSGDIQKGGI